MQPRQDHAEWKISTEVVSLGGGSAIVEVGLTNGRVGQMAPFSIQVDLHPGMEPVDVRILVLSILAAGGKGLHDEAIAEGARLVQSFR